MKIQIAAWTALACLALSLLSATASGQGVPASAAGPDWIAGIREIGFPAAAFVMLFALVITTLRDNTKAIQELVVAVRELRANCQRDKE